MTDLAELGRGVVEPRPLGRAVPEAPAPPRLFDFEVDGSVDATSADQSRPLDPLHGELIAGAGAALLLGALWLLPWFSIDRVATARGSSLTRSLSTAVGSEGAWQALAWMRWVLVVAGVVALLPLLARLARRWVGLPRGTHGVVAAMGALAALMLTYRVLIDMPDPSRVVDQRAGAILGLLAASAIAVGGVQSTRARAARTRARNERGQPVRATRAPGHVRRIDA